MANAHCSKLLTLSMATMVASGVLAVVGYSVAENALVGRTTYISYEMDHGGYTGGYTGGDMGGYTGGTTGTAAPVVAPTTSVSKYTQCVENCGFMGWPADNADCASGCKNKSGAPSAAEAAKTAPKDRCAYTANDTCLTKCSCAASNYGSPNAAESGTELNKFFVDGKKILGGCIDVCEAAAAQKVATPPSTPVVETPPTPLATPTPSAPVAAGEERTAAPPPPSFDEEAFSGFEERGGDFGGFEGGFPGGFEGGFHGGPGDFGMGGDFGFPMGDFEHFEDIYGMEFDPEMMQEGFEEYFGGFGPGGMEFGMGGGEFGGEFGGMPEWMGDELEDMKDMMRDMAEDMCPHLVEEIDGIEDFEGLEELGFRMQEECGGGGGFGGPMEDPSEIVAMLRAMGGIGGGLEVLVQNGFDKATAGRIRGLLTQVSTAADEAEDACADLGFGGEEEEEDFFGLKGLLAQFLDDEDEEEDDDEDFFGDDDEEEDEGDEDFDDEDEEGGACREAIEKAFSLMDPDSDEDYPNSIRGIMQPAIEDYFRKLHAKDEAKSREVFAAFMKEMAPVVVGNDMELSDEDIDRMYDMLVASDFDFDMVASPSTDHGEWETDDIGRDFGGDFGDFDEEEEEEGGKAGGGGFGGEEEEGGKAGGGGFEEEEEESEDFEF